MTAVELRHVSRNGVTHGIGLMGHRPGDNYSIGKTARGLFCKIGILRLMFLRSLYVHLPIDPLCCPPLTATQATLVVGRRLRYPCRGVLRTSSAGELLRTKGRMEKTASHFAFPVLPHPILHCLSCSSPSSLPPSLSLPLHLSLSLSAQYLFGSVPQCGAKHYLSHSDRLQNLREGVNLKQKFPPSLKPHGLEPPLE